MIDAVSGGQVPTSQIEAARRIQTFPETPSVDAGDAFRETLTRVHDEIGSSSAEIGRGSPALDRVEIARNEILPSPWKVAAGGDAKPQSAAGVNSAKGFSDNNEVLKRSFDHAIQVTLVSQVLGGLSQTTSTLIRQQ